MNTNKEVVLKYVEAFNSGDVDRVGSLFAQDAQIWGVLGWGTPEEARPIWKDLGKPGDIGKPGDKPGDRRKITHREAGTKSGVDPVPGKAASVCDRTDAI
jgi:hypothetical protein